MPAVASDTSSCAPTAAIASGGGCPAATPDYYGGQCRPRTVCSGTQTMNCVLASPCVTPPPTPACVSGQINIGTAASPICKTLVNVIADTFFKIWNGTALKRLVYVDDADCTDKQVIQWNLSGKKWECVTVASQWTTSGSAVYYSGAVGIGNSGPEGSYQLDVTGAARFTGEFRVTGEGNRVVFPDGTIDSREILDGTITSADLSSSAGITSDNIADGAITEDDIAVNSVGSSELQNDSVTTRKLSYYFAAESTINLQDTSPAGVATSSCGSGLALGGECWGTTASGTRSDAINITGMYRDTVAIPDTVYSVENNAWRCRGFNTSVSDRVLHAKALCLTY